MTAPIDWTQITFDYLLKVLQILIGRVISDVLRQKLVLNIKNLDAKPALPCTAVLFEF